MDWLRDLHDKAGKATPGPTVCSAPKEVEWELCKCKQRAERAEAALEQAEKALRAIERMRAKNGAKLERAQEIAREALAVLGDAARQRRRRDGLAA